MYWLHTKGFGLYDSELTWFSFSEQGNLSAAEKRYCGADFFVRLGRYFGPGLDVSFPHLLPTRDTNAPPAYRLLKAVALREVS